MKRVLFFLFIAVFPFCAYAQKEANNWFFGKKAGMTWNTTRSFTARGLYGTPAKTVTGMPTDLGFSSISTTEGCFSLSRPDGKVLCYSDGMTVWDTDGRPMPDGKGLKGDASAAQSGILLPYPGEKDKYIVVSIGQYNASAYYSVLDMSLNGGLGNIDITQKNILLDGASGILGETITSIQHENGRDYWIVAPGRGTPGVLNAWLVDETGVHSSAPAKTTVLPVNLTGYNNPSGYMKFAPDGEHFALATARSKYFIVGTFNAGTGEFQDIKAWTSSDLSSGGPYGVEFSQSGEFVYMTDFQNLFAFRFNELMSAPDPLTVKPKLYKSLGSQASGSESSAIQLGPDGRLYIVTHANFLYFVDNPEEYDNLRIYVTDNFLSGNGGEGLPSFVASYFVLDGDKLFCMNTLKEFTVSVSPRIGGKLVSYTKWDFGDGSEFVKVSGSGKQKVSHLYDRPGDYTITVSAYHGVDELLSSPITKDVRSSSCVMPVNPNIHIR